MKIYKTIGSKERFNEMFQGVTKTKLNEESMMGFQSDGGSTAILEQSFYDLKNKLIRVNNTNSRVDGDDTYVEINCTDKNGYEVMFSFKMSSEMTDQDNVLSVSSAQLISFTLNNPTQPIVMDESELQRFNEQHSEEMIDIISEFADIEDSTEMEDNQYNEAVELIDKCPYSKNTEEMQTNETVDKKNEYILKANKILLRSYQETGNKPSREEHIGLVKQGAMRLQELDNVNEDSDKNNYPDQIGTKFKPKNQFPKKKKKPQSVVKLSEEDIDISNLPDVPSGYGAQKSAKADIGNHYTNKGVHASKTGETPSDEWDKHPMPYNKEFNEGEETVDDVEQVVTDKEETGDMFDGGLADDETASSFDPEQLAMGLKVEMEHTDDPMIAIEIAMDHLTEKGDYYTQLADMEGEEHVEEPENSDMTDELLGFKSNNVGDEMEYGSEVHPLANVLKTGDDEDLSKGKCCGKCNKGVNKALSENNYNDEAFVREYEELIEEYGERIVGHIFTSGLEGFIESRTKGNYSIDAIRQTLGYLSGNINEEDSEPFQPEIGDRYEDANNNQFTVSKETNDGIGLRGNEGEKEIDASGLEFMKKLDEINPINEQELKIARDVMKDRGFDNKMTKKEAIQIIIKHNVRDYLYN